VEREAVEREAVGSWPARRRMPDLTTLDEPTQRVVVATIDRLRESLDSWADRFLRLAREHVPGYDLLDDDDIRTSARTFVSNEIAELESLRLPDDALRSQLEAFALRRVAQGVSTETLSLSYGLGSREMLALMDEIAAEVGMPTDLLLAIHDSTWEFANEASAVFARVQHGLLVERARVDAERLSAFTRGVLGGAFSSHEIDRDAAVFGLDARRHYVALALRASSTAEADAMRRLIAAATRTTADRLLFAEMGTAFGCIAPSAPGNVGTALVGIGPSLPLDELGHGFEEAVQALEAAERFGIRGAVRLGDLGPKPLVQTAGRAATILAERHIAPLEREGRTGEEVLRTLKVYLECDQDAVETGRRLTVHPNTVRYRVTRFRDVTGLDVRSTEGLVTAWWLLNRRDW
jgi:hypothetical protein